MSRLDRDFDKPRVRRFLAVLAALHIMLAASCVFWASATLAQGAGLLSSSYLTPFPKSDRYQLRLIGDGLGPGLTEALKDAFRQENTLEIADMSRWNYGVVRAEQTDLYGEIDRMIVGSGVNIAVIMLGVNDRASFKMAAGSIRPGTAEWKEAYSKGAEKLIKKLKSANIAVYWVGLPVMGDPAFSETVAQMNDAIRQAAYENGVKFIETWAGFTDQLGAYSAYGPDLTGQTKRLRDGDGVGLTAAGYRKLANYIETALRRDLAYAKAQRNIPLAGDEEEQARVVPNASRPAPAKAAANPADAPVEAGSEKAVPSGGKASDAKADAAMPASAVQETQKRDLAVFGSTSYQGSEFIISDLGDGLTSIAVISPGDFSMREIQKQTPLSDRLYFKVLSRGEALAPKDGRADDFRWRGGSAPAQAQAQ